MEEKSGKKRLWIYLGIAYGVTFLMGLFMWYGRGSEMDLNVFPIAQMMYPAAGVILGYLVTRKGDRELPRWFFLLFLFLTAGLAGLAVLSVLFPDQLVFLAGTPVSLWNMAAQYVMRGGSLTGWVLLLAAGKKRRAAYGLGWRNGKVSLLVILLFVVLYFARTAFALALEGKLPLFGILLETPATWITMAFLPLNFLLCFVCFFGEEYGWRYYLQPLLQERFGLRGGVLLLGVVWGLWHVPVDFFYYTASVDMGWAMAAAQQITCITLGIFFAYAYEKTQNLWVPVLLHFLNNNLVAVVSGNYSSDVLQNQTVAWGDLLPALLVNGLVFGIFLFAKPFKGGKK